MTQAGTFGPISGAISRYRLAARSEKKKLATENHRKRLQAEPSNKGDSDAV